METYYLRDKITEAIYEIESSLYHDAGDETSS